MSIPRVVIVGAGSGRALIGGLPNVDFRLAEVSGVNFSLRRVDTGREPIGYGYLIMAAGAVNDYFHNAGVAARSFRLNDLGATQALRNRILSCFEAATCAVNPAERARLLSFAVVGGGPTGVEFSAALSVLVAEMTGKALIAEPSWPPWRSISRSPAPTLRSPSRPGPGPGALPPRRPRLRRGRAGRPGPARGHVLGVVLRRIRGEGMTGAIASLIVLLGSQAGGGLPEDAASR